MIRNLRKSLICVGPIKPLKGFRPIVIAATLLTTSWNVSFAQNGNIPEGLWQLNLSRSHKLVPGTNQILWIIQDDGKNLSFVSVEKDPANQIKVSSCAGLYNGPPATVVGTGMKSSIVSKVPGTLLNFGDIPGVGDYSENCVLKNENKELYCEGEVKTPSGTKSYVEDFDWKTAAPNL